jgi:hypothetical protein
MYRVFDDSPKGTVGIKVNGKLTKEDYSVLIPYLENRIKESGSLNMLCDMTKCMGMEIEAFWEDFKFSIRHLNDFKRMAGVGDQRWLEWIAKSFNPLFNTEMKYFHPDQLEEAWDWLNT